MIYEIDLLSPSDLHTLNNFYSFVNFKDGGLSGSTDKKLKYNMAVSDEIHYQTMVDILNVALDNQPYFNYKFMPNHHSDPVFLKYEKNMHYDYHNDFPVINGVRTDYSVTCFLNDPEDYEGGELSLLLGDTEVKYKLKSGKALIYPTGLWHKVHKVTSGVRRVAVWWFESIIMDPTIREILLDFSTTLIDNKKDISVRQLQSFENIRYRLIRHHANFH